MGRYSKVFSKEMEAALAKHVTDLEARFYGMTRKTLMKVAYEFAVQNGLENRFNDELKVAGKDWVYRFLEDSGLSLRTPEQCSLGRAMGFNKVQVERYFVNLQTCLEKYKFLPHRIFNMDETGVSTVPDKTAKIVAKKGKRSVKKIKSAERGQLVTGVFCVNPTGNFIPPALIFPRKRNKPELYKDAPTGCLGLISESGYMNSELFLDWLEHFAKYTKPSEDDPVLLILDNHVSHCSLSSVELCRKNNIVLLTLPPHASHMLQPLDKVIFAPFKKFYADEIEKWMCSHPGRAVTQMDVAGLFGAAFKRVATIGKAEAAFRDTGIHPFNPDVISEDDFLCAEPTRIELPVAEDIDNSSVAIEPAEDGDVQNEGRPDEVLDNGRTEAEVQIRENTEESQIEVIPIAGTSSGPMVSVTAIYPLPKAQKLTKRKRIGQKSEILTATPYKDMLIEKQKSKEKEEKKKVENAKARAERKLIKSNAELVQKSTAKRKLTFDMRSASNQPSPSQVYICPGCDESCEDEDWVQCCECDEWWHELCSSYEGLGVFSCDYCKKNMQ